MMDMMVMFEHVFIIIILIQVSLYNKLKVLLHQKILYAIKEFQNQVNWKKLVICAHFWNLSLITPDQK